MNPSELNTLRAFRSLDGDTLGRLAGILTEKVYSNGQTIFTEGEPGDGMYFILAGAARLEKRMDAGATRKTIGVLTAGDFFGVRALFDPQARPASAIAEGPTRVVILGWAAFDAFMAANGPAGVRMLLAMLETTSDWVRLLCAHMLAYDEIGKAIGEAGNLDPLLEAIGRQLCQATLADWGIIALQAQFSDRIELRSSVNLQLTTNQKAAWEGEAGLLAVVLRSSRDQLVADVSREEPYKSCAHPGLETAALLVAPISLEGRSLGIILLGGQQAGQFNLNDLNLARGIARQASQAILNARHRDEEAARARHHQRFVRF